MPTSLLKRWMLPATGAWNSRLPYSLKNVGQLVLTSQHISFFSYFPISLPDDVNEDLFLSYVSHVGRRSFKRELQQKMSVHCRPFYPRKSCRVLRQFFSSSSRNTCNLQTSMLNFAGSYGPVIMPIVTTTSPPSSAPCAACTPTSFPRATATLTRLAVGELSLTCCRMPCPENSYQNKSLFCSSRIVRRWLPHYLNLWQRRWHVIITTLVICR